jgi:hypothetical protein
VAADLIDVLARRVDFGKLSTPQFIRLLETLHMLEQAEAGVRLRGLSTQTFVDVVRRASKEQQRRGRRPVRDRQGQGEGRVRARGPAADLLRHPETGLTPRGHGFSMTG